MKEIPFYQISNNLLEQLIKGAFLIVRDSNAQVNVMTIGWGTIGYMWRKPFYTVGVRNSRYTYELIENSENFGVSIPLDGKLKKEIQFCGTQSGRHINKIQECNFTMIPSPKNKTLFIEQCDIHLECKIVYKHQFDYNKFISKEILDFYGEGSNYPDSSFYFGEILGCYKKLII